MRVLYLTPRFPYPPLKGDQVVAHHRLRLLSKRHEISVLSFVEDDADAAAVTAIAGYCEQVQTVRLPKWRSVANVAMRAPFRSTPLQIAYYESVEFRRRATRLLDDGGFDLVHAFFHRVAPYASHAAIPNVLDLMDSMQLRMRRNARVARPPKRWLFREELRRVTAWELEAVRMFDEVIVVSEQDRRCLPADNVSVVFNGVDADVFAPRLETRARARVIFAGNMSYDPNVEAVTWFAERCWPRVRAAVPEAELTIAGSRPAAAVRQLERLPGVRVTGYVDSMPAALNTASVAIAPMQSGSGIQNKILEAMACELPVVTTTIGYGGLPAVPGRDMIVVDAPEEFATAVTALLLDSARARDLARRGREYVLREHTWEAAAARVDGIYERAVARRR